jgi:hypothetical protein
MRKMKTNHRKRGEFMAETGTVFIKTIKNMLN